MVLNISTEISLWFGITRKVKHMVRYKYNVCIKAEI